MDDRTLLELAAKAAEIDIRMWLPTRQIGSFKPLAPWNPLSSDGDALRLAVKLHLFLDITDDRTQACLSTGDTEDSIEIHGSSDPYAATRRAIVRAAAEIGKAMP